jgi:hypothetical protein
MTKAGIKVLLLGERAMGSSVIRRRLEQRGCQCWFAVSPEEGLELFQQHEFQLLLGTGPVNQANSLIALLDDANHCSAYCAYPVEDSCVWVPLLDHGRKCLGAPVLRPSEFVTALDDLITGIESEQLVAAIAAPVPARRRPAKASSA